MFRLWKLAISSLLSTQLMAGEVCPPLATQPSDAELYQALDLQPQPARAMLYQVRKGRLNSLLFGTTHLGPPLIKQASPRVILALLKSKTLVVEAIPDQQSAQQWYALSTAAEPLPLARELGPQLYKKYLRLAAHVKVPPTRAAQLKPWAAMLAIGSPPNRDLGIDQQLLQHARRARLKIKPLQSLGEIAQALNSLKLDDQVTMLRDTICQSDTLPRYMSQLARLYASGEPKLIKIYNRWGRENDPVFARFTQTMVNDRNKAFLATLLRHLEKGEVFISVGAEHLVGEHGLIALLQAEGYQVTRQP
ncbi:MAG: TraB/GumN family protein [Granulosicoccaceae bacterium]